MSEDCSGDVGSESVAGVLLSLSQLQNDDKVSGNEAEHIRKVLESNQIKGLISVYGTLSQIRGEAGIPGNNTALAMEIMGELERYDDADCRELFGLMSKPYFRGLIDAHDNIRYDSLKSNPELPAQVST